MFAGVPPLLALLTPLEPVEPQPVEGDTLDVLLPDLEVPEPTEPLAERPTRSFERWLADERPVEIQAREREPREVFVPASVEVLVRDAAGSSAPTSPDGKFEAPQASRRPELTASGSSARTASIREFSPDQALKRPELTVSSSSARTAPVIARPIHSALDLVRSPEMQAPPTLDDPGGEPRVEADPETADPETVRREISQATPAPTPRRTRSRARPQAEPVKVFTTPTGTTVEIEAPERPLQVAEAVEVQAEAPRPTLDTPTPLPQRVQVRIDEDLDVAIEADSEGIGVVVEGTAEAVEPLRELADELADELAQGGLELTDFDARERDGERHEGQAASGTASEASPQQQTTSTHDGLVEVIA